MKLTGILICFPEFFFTFLLLCRRQFKLKIAKLCGNELERYYIYLFHKKFWEKTKSPGFIG